LVLIALIAAPLTRASVRKHAGCSYPASIRKGR
jgi:hypothetical protein